MSTRLNITIDADIFEFIEKNAGGNRSAFVNKILKEAKRRVMEEALKRGLVEDMNDPEYREELALWDTCVGDGLEDDE